MLGSFKNDPGFQAPDGMAKSFEKDYFEALGTEGGRPFYWIAGGLRHGIAKGWILDEIRTGDAGTTYYVNVTPNPIPRDYIYHISHIQVYFWLVSAGVVIASSTINVLLTADKIPLHVVHFASAGDSNVVPVTPDVAEQELNIYVPYNYRIALSAGITITGGNASSQVSVAASIDGHIFKDPHPAQHGQDRVITTAEVPDLIAAYQDTAAWPAGGS